MRKKDNDLWLTISIRLISGTAFGIFLSIAWWTRSQARLISPIHDNNDPNIINYLVPAICALIFVIFGGKMRL